MFCGLHNLIIMISYNYNIIILFTCKARTHMHACNETYYVTSEMHGLHIYPCAWSHLDNISIYNNIGHHI